MKLLQITTEKVETLETHSSKGKPYKKPRKKTEYQKKELQVTPDDTSRIIYERLTGEGIEKNIEKIAKFIAALTVLDKEKMAEVISQGYLGCWLDDSYQPHDIKEYKFED